MPDFARFRFSLVEARELKGQKSEKLNSALEQLKWAQSSTQEASILALVNYRIARIETELGNFAAANAALDNVLDTAWSGRIAELRGDIALRQGDKDAAYTAYTEAQQAKDANPALKMKLDDLAK